MRPKSLASDLHNLTRFIFAAAAGLSACSDTGVASKAQALPDPKANEPGVYELTDTLIRTGGLDTQKPSDASDTSFSLQSNFEKFRACDKPNALGRMLSLPRSARSEEIYRTPAGTFVIGVLMPKARSRLSLAIRIEDGRCGVLERLSGTPGLNVRGDGAAIAFLLAYDTMNFPTATGTAPGTNPMNERTGRALGILSAMVASDHGDGGSEAAPAPLPTPAAPPNLLQVLAASKNLTEEALVGRQFSCFDWQAGSRVCQLDSPPQSLCLRRLKCNSIAYTFSGNQLTAARMELSTSDAAGEFRYAESSIGEPEQHVQAVNGLAGCSMRTVDRFDSSEGVIQFEHTKCPTMIYAYYGDQTTVLVGLHVASISRRSNVSPHAAALPPISSSSVAAPSMPDLGD